MKILVAPLVLLATCSLPQAHGQVIVAEDFQYAQPTKEFGAGGGFTRQAYGGGQHGTLGEWTDPWVSFGDGVISGTDISEETFVVETDMFAGVTRNGLSDNWLDRDYSIDGLDNDQTLFFGITMRSNSELGAPNATFHINDAGGPAQIGMGFAEEGFRALLGNPEETGDVEVIAEPGLTSGLDAHRLIGKLEFNANGPDEQLTVWLDPSGVETAEETAQVQADIVTGLSDFNGNLRLDHTASTGLMFWDDLALGTTWESVAEVNIPRVSLQVDTDSRDVTWKNETGTDLDVTFLQVESSRGIVDSRWESLTDQGIPGFSENNPSNTLLTESNLFGSLAFNDGATADWGRIYRSGDDLIGRVGTADGLLNVANVVYGEFPDEPMVDADFDDSGDIDVADIDALCLEVAAGSNMAAFDLTGDGVVNADDVANFLEMATVVAGDVDLDGEVGFADFLVLSANFGQSDRTWSHGDTDCNGAVEFGDFLALSANFGTSAGTAAVPEPTTNVCVILVGLCFVGRRRGSRKQI